ncbi:MAG: hypothetical protein RR975_11665 [Clostridia bacterium]
MKLNHKVSISVREPDGGARNVLNGGEVKLREKLLRWLFGEKKKVLVIAPSDSVFNVEIREQNLSKLFDEYLDDILLTNPAEEQAHDTDRKEAASHDAKCSIH